MRVPRERTSRTPLSMILGLMAALLLCACGGGNGGAGATDATETAQSKGGTRGAPTSTTTTTTVTGSATATLAWSAPQTNADGSAMTQLAGFRIYYGTAHGDYSRMISVDSASTLSYTIQNLAPGTYYMVVAAVDVNNNESLPSPEASKTVQ
ncbi:MAG: fibronectin type III domain-containing protein [Betaproteobacteria bacterium]|nr:MAG: fibronectin type III domain-containing protein [Betaproteobacteria bacterium]